MSTQKQHTQKKHTARRKRGSSSTVKSRRGSVALPATPQHAFHLTRLFRKVSQKIGKVVGSPWCFVSACAFVLIWLLSGPLFGYSNTWQLVINTSTTIVTFLMIFLLQNTQNRDTKALHLKLDELILVNKQARNILLDAEDELDDEELERVNQEFRKRRLD